MAEVAERYGPYTCVRRLGAGGMAETFLAVQHGAAGFEQRVCMKFMLPALRSDPTFRQQFLREATIAASLRHANIVGVIDVDEPAGYIVLELVDGVDLRTLLNATPNRRLPSSVVALIAIELCKALAYAHGRTRRGLPDGIVHRDISPSNVLISHNGEVKLTDFGVAKAMRAASEPASGGIKGKLCYMSPEQTRGDHLDGRSDLFSLGVMLFELLAGKRPFDGPTDAQTLLRIEAGRHPALTELVPDVPGGLALVVERMLRRDADHRYPTADACIDALARFAPPITTYRELGQLARAARAPVTLSSAEFGIATPDSGSRLVEPLVHTRRSPVPPPPGMEELRRPKAVQAQPVTVADTVDMPVAKPRHVEPARPPASFRKRFSGVSRTAWFTLGASLCAGMLVLLAWVSRLGIGELKWPSRGSSSAGAVLTSTAHSGDVEPPAERRELTVRSEGAVRSQAEPARAAAVSGKLPSDDAREDRAATQSPASAVPDRPKASDADSEPAHRSPLVRPLVPDRPNPAFTSVSTPTKTGGGAAQSEPPASGHAVLRVGTVPLGQVWIDGQAAGWAPVIVELAPGLHTVAGGNTKPEVTRSVRLRAGESKRLVLSLEEDAWSGDEATPSRANR